MSRISDFGAYDANLDYLTQVVYDDDDTVGTTNITNSWTYDYAGNRSTSGHTYDNLNRMLTSPDLIASIGADWSYEHDVVGNRTGRNMTVMNSPDAVKYEWDHTNRMEKIMGIYNGYRNEYRADGMRMKKVTGFDLNWEWTDKSHTSGYYDEHAATNLETNRYFYDGQMCVEDEHTLTGTVTRTKYGLGARGIEFISKKVGSGAETIGYPVYDGHGNMVMTISKAGSSPYFADGLHRGYDVWGSMRWNPSASTDIKPRYSANLGHAEDDESGLQYMRARFYEPWTGRFVSADINREGNNHFIFCDNDPIGKTDYSGRSWRTAEKNLRTIFMVLALIYLLKQCAQAVTSLEIENAYGYCMKAFSFSFLDTLGAPEWLCDSVDLLGKAFDIGSSVLQGAANGFALGGGDLNGGLKGAVMGYYKEMLSSLAPDYAYIFYCHGLRLCWYIDDIDNF